MVTSAHSTEGPLAHPLTVCAHTCVEAESTGPRWWLFTERVCQLPVQREMVARHHLLAAIWPSSHSPGVSLRRVPRRSNPCHSLLTFPVSRSGRDSVLRGEAAMPGLDAGTLCRSSAWPAGDWLATLQWMEGVTCLPSLLRAYLYLLNREVGLRPPCPLPACLGRASVCSGRSGRSSCSGAPLARLPSPRAALGNSYIIGSAAWPEVCC